MFNTQLGNIAGEEGKLYLRPETLKVYSSTLSMFNALRVRKYHLVLLKSVKLSEMKSWRVSSFSVCASSSKWKCNFSFALALKKSGTQVERIAYEMAFGFGYPQSKCVLKTMTTWRIMLMLRWMSNLNSFCFKELEGIHSRTDFDLSSHQKLSVKNYNISTLN